MILKDTDKINVSISMQTFQNSEKFTNNYTGTFQIKNSKKYLIYKDEYEKCSLVIDENVVRLNKFSSGTVMTFEKDCEHICSYATPMGRLALSVVALEITDSLCQGGTLAIEYIVSVVETEPINNKIYIKIEEI